jgi:hypothetical protein
MAKNNWSTPIVLVVLAGIFLQVIFSMAENQSSPHRTALAFSKAYYALDPKMDRYLCEGLKANDDVNLVAEYRNRRFDEARERGLPLSYMKGALYHYETETRLGPDGKSAEVRLTALRRTAINPVFAWVAKLFFIGQNQPVEAVLELVKENGAWKVCGNPFGLAGNG